MAALVSKGKKGKGELHTDMWTGRPYTLSQINPVNRRGMSAGLKFDQGKVQWDLVPMGVIAGVARVLTFGAIKYKKDSWKSVDPTRYYSAMMRHLESISKVEVNDPESKENHMFHFLTNAVFLTYFVVVKGENAWISQIFGGK